MMEATKGIKAFHIGAAFCIITLIYLSLSRPYLFDQSYLAECLGLQAALLIALQYETYFWISLVTVFFWAGSAFPMSAPMNLFRWVLLGLAAIIGLGYYGKRTNDIKFNRIHLLGLFTVVAAFASVLVSTNPLLTSLKALSLAALFTYGSVGARILWARHPEQFIARLLFLVEALVYLTAICYSASFGVWGNPNSLGVIMGVLCWPVSLWRFLISRTRSEYVRGLSALCICGILLVSSLSRASLLAAFVSSIFLLVGGRRYRTLLIGSSVCTAALLFAFLWSPDQFRSSSDVVLYKQGEHGKLMQSREKPWAASIASFREHPWLGLGFGAADNSAEWRLGVATIGQQTRERGSSYLTILEGTGIVGALPFALLVLCLLREIRRVYSWLRRTGNLDHPSIVPAILILGGLISAFFEDWLLAVGYYMCVIVWVPALLFCDWMACPDNLSENLRRE
jgi:O-antigen ligase